MHYDKPHLSIPALIERLKSRGLHIGDERLAADVLSSVNYYRFTGYAFAFTQQNERDRFQQGTTFEDVMRLYRYDILLRDKLFEALEASELVFRTILSSRLSSAT